MIKAKKIIVSLLMLVCVNVYAQQMKYEKLEINMFPEAKEGFKKVYIQVPIEKNEENFKVEVFVGKEALLDCNKYFLIGNITEKNLDGWGYNFYEIESSGEMGGTKMACPQEKLTNKFVYLQPLLLRYNSKLPIVLYVPNDFVIKYKIFKADSKLYHAKEASTKETSSVNKINYTTLNNYFVKNNVKQQGAFKITSQNEFDKFFGAATVMGKNGKPTKIDFSKQTVVTIILNETAKNTTIQLSNLMLDAGNNIILNYSTKVGEKQTYTTKPFILLAIDKKYSGKLIAKKQ